MENILEKRILKRNLFGLYIACFGEITRGLGNLETNISSFLSIFVGDWSIVLMKVVFFLSTLLLFFVAPIITHKKAKKALIFFELYENTLYLTIFLLMYNNILNPYILLTLILMIASQKKLSDILWTEFELRVLPVNKRQNYYGNAAFLVSFGTIFGMYISSKILKFDPNFAYTLIFGIIFIIGFLLTGLFILFLDDDHVKIEEENKKMNFKYMIETWKDLIKNKSIVKLLKFKAISILGYSFIFLFSFLAIKDGYSPELLAKLGLIYWISYSIAGLIFGRLKIKFTDMIVVSRLIFIISYIVLITTNNYYIVFAIYPFAIVSNEIGNLNILGLITKQKNRTNALSLYYIIDLLVAACVALYAFIIYEIGLNSSVFIASTLTIVSIIYLNKIDFKVLQ